MIVSCLRLVLLASLLAGYLGITRFWRHRARAGVTRACAARFARVTDSTPVCVSPALVLSRKTVDAGVLRAPVIVCRTRVARMDTGCHSAAPRDRLSPALSSRLLPFACHAGHIRRSATRRSAHSHASYTDLAWISATPGPVRTPASPRAASHLSRTATYLRRHSPFMTSLISLACGSDARAGFCCCSRMPHATCLRHFTCCNALWIAARLRARVLRSSSFSLLYCSLFTPAACVSRNTFLISYLCPLILSRSRFFAVLPPFFTLSLRLLLTFAAV